MLISLVVVGGAIAIVLWITVGDMAQPATKDDEAAGRPADRHLAVVIPVEAGVAVDDRDTPASAIDEATPGADGDDVTDEADATYEADDADDAVSIGALEPEVDDGPGPDDGHDDHDDALGDPEVTTDVVDDDATDVVDDDAPEDERAAAGGVRHADVAGLVVVEAAPAPVVGADVPDGEVVADAMGPVEGTVPQAVPARPAESATAGRAPSAAHSVLTIPGTYSFDPAPPVTWGRRLRSALGVVLVVTAVGLALAASLGLLAVYVSRALEGAVN